MGSETAAGGIHTALLLFWATIDGKRRRERWYVGQNTTLRQYLGDRGVPEVLRS